MYLELAQCSTTTSSSDIQQAAFAVDQFRLNSLIVPNNYLDLAAKFLVPCGTTIDFPYGNSPTSLRLYSILLAAQSKSKYADVVLGYKSILDNDLRALKEDLVTCATVCKNNAIALRVILEYRIYEFSDILEILKLLRSVGVDHIITGTGTIADDIVDNLIICDHIRRNGLKPIIPLPVLADKQLKEVSKAILYGIRFQSIKAVERYYEFCE